jgi:uncharacterized protein DUF1360
MGWFMEAMGDKVSATARAYSDAQPLAGYSAAMAAYGTGLTALVGAAVLTRHRARPLSAGDIALMTIATHKMSRLLAKDAVTSPLRAAGTRFTGSAGAGELHEEVRGQGVRHTFGEMVSCPFCLDVWVATALCAGFVFAPRVTRLIASCLTAVAGADFLQLAYDAAKAASRNTG